MHIDLPYLVQLIGYPGLFAAVYLETGLFFGFFLPGASMLFIAGLLASQGVFNVWLLASLIALAAILGDATGYAFGRYVGTAIFTWADTRFFHKDHVEQTQAFFKRWGRVTIFLARFVPIVRTFAPILAGVGKMEMRTFFAYNIAGAVVWGSGVVFLGYFLGTRVPNIEKYITLIVTGIIAVTLIPLAFTYLRSRKRAAPGHRQPRAVIFDLDNTLAESFTPLAPEVANALKRLVARMPVGIMTGATFDRMKTFTLPALADAELSNLYLFPDTAAQCFRFQDGTWRPVYSHVFTKNELVTIAAALKRGIDETKIVGDGDPTWGERIVVREQQVTFSGLGGEAPPDKKAAWDPDRAKRKKLKAFLDAHLTGFDIRISSRTAIDITRTGVDKAHGVRWLAKHLKLEPTDMLFVGDDLGEGGNDAVVIPTGIATRHAKGPHEAAGVIDELIATRRD